MNPASSIWNLLFRKKNLYTAREKKTNQLREFIYLDEVSLRSLLSSLKGGVTESNSSNRTISSEEKLGGALAVDVAAFAKAELASHFQTSNSSTIQTSRKATVQSWFAELHSFSETRLIGIQDQIQSANNIEQLLSEECASLSVHVGKLKRGKLIEMRIRLSADRIFKFGTMISEFASFAEEWPAMMQGSIDEHSLEEARGISKFLKRLLTGLIPIRCEAIDYSVIELNGEEYIAHNSYLAGLNIKNKPLTIVAVTEHLAYWKDIRRVLFSDAEFTMLCRLAKSGLQNTWNPVKLGDLFKEVVPGIVDQIHSATLFPMNSQLQTPAESMQELQMRVALRTYFESSLRTLCKTISEEQNTEIENLIEGLINRANSNEGQRASFKCLQIQIEKITGSELTPEQEIEIREEARVNSGLTQFPTLVKNTINTPGKQTAENKYIEEKLLDVEVVAIYW